MSPHDKKGVAGAYDKMTPTEVRAYNAGVEEVRKLARRERAERLARPKNGILVRGIITGLSIVNNEATGLLIAETEGAQS